MPKFYTLFVLLISLIIACETPATTQEAASNPPAKGFNEAGSDPQAIALADEVMAAMGGRNAWDQTRYLRFTFNGRRALIWDKLGKKVRIEVPQDSLVYLLDYQIGYTAQTYQNGKLFSEPDSVLKYTEQARRIWINDTYWLVMPFKLKDSGVTLTYLGEDETEVGEPAEVIELTFDGVGVTPQNKYQVWVSKQDKLVIQWAYFQEASE
ncbi:MAG: hypothetical protein AAF804_06795 [Bacteroidota bacterium]